MPATAVDDAAAASAAVVFWPVQEWIIHDRLLHSEEEWFGERIHEWHHALPYYHVSFDSVELAAGWFLAAAAAFLALTGGFDSIAEEASTIPPSQGASSTRAVSRRRATRHCTAPGPRWRSMTFGCTMH